MEHKSFFSHSKTFWLLNCSGWGIIVAYFYFRDIFIGAASVAHYDAILLFILGVVGTFAGLVFRRFYYRLDWSHKSWYSLIPHALLMALVSAIIFGLVIAAFIYVARTFVDAQSIKDAGNNSDFVQWVRKLYGDMPKIKIMVISFIANGILAFVLVMFWCLLYIAIMANRKIKESALRSLQLENSLKEARLNMLAGQINPHFLFNALNNIRFQIHENAAKADESIISLSEILRYSLGSSKKEKVTVREELEVVNRYLELMKNQMEDKLKYTIEVGEHCRGYLIPPMMIQMLTENAIKHGLDQRSGGGYLDIRCEERDASLCISVCNDKADDGRGDDESSSGIGLENIKKRLSLLYGGKAQFTMSISGQRVIATVCLPKEAAQ